MYGMTEEQFWESNPRIISVWEKAYKAKMNATNEFIHSWVGTYGLSAVTVAVEHCLHGRKAKTKYIEKPVQLYELTEEEKEREAEKERRKFIEWAKAAMNKNKRKEGDNG